MAKQATEEQAPRTVNDLPQAGTAYPRDLAHFIWEWKKPLPLCDTEQILYNFISHAFQASLRTEEGRNVRLRLLFHPQSSQVTVRFKTPIPYTTRELIKFAPTVGLGFRFLVVEPSTVDTDILNIVGICDPTISPSPKTTYNKLWGKGLHFPMPQIDGMQLIVFDPGTVRLITADGKSFDLNEGNIKFPIALNRIAPVRQWQSKAAMSLGLHSKHTASRAKDKDEKQDALAAYDAIIRLAWINILRKVCNERHGGCFLVIPEKKKVSSDLVKIKYELETTQFRDAVKARCSLEPQLSRHIAGGIIDPGILENAPFFEGNLARVSDLVASLAAVDGAVILRQNLHIVGAGSEILGTENQDKNDRIEFSQNPDWPDSRQDVRLVSTFGMRHRSAIRFCQQVPDALAFVVSQDGDLRIFVKVENTMRAYEPTLDDVY